jgi:hypothetical protein
LARYETIKRLTEEAERQFSFPLIITTSATKKHGLGVLRNSIALAAGVAPLPGTPEYGQIKASLLPEVPLLTGNTVKLPKKESKQEKQKLDLELPDRFKFPYKPLPKNKKQSTKRGPWSNPNFPANRKPEEKKVYHDNSFKKAEKAPSKPASGAHTKAKKSKYQMA